jgi:hypothetical protein
MVNTLAFMHNLKGKQIGFTQAFPQAKIKEDIIYLRFPAGFEHKNEKWALKLKYNLYMIIVLYTDDCILYARDTKETESFVKILRDDYKLTLNDPDPIYDLLGIHFSHQDNVELHMSQTGFIDAVTESNHIPKG